MKCLPKELLPKFQKLRKKTFPVVVESVSVCTPVPAKDDSVLKRNALDIKVSFKPTQKSLK